MPCIQRDGGISERYLQLLINYLATEYSHWVAFQLCIQGLSIQTAMERRCTAVRKAGFYTPARSMPWQRGRKIGRVLLICCPPYPGRQGVHQHVSISSAAPIQRSSAVLMIFFTTLTVEMICCGSSLQNTGGPQIAAIKPSREQVPPPGHTIFQGNGERPRKPIIVRDAERSCPSVPRCQHFPRRSFS